MGFDNDIQCSYSSLSTTTTITLEGWVREEWIMVMVLLLHRLLTH